MHTLLQQMGRDIVKKNTEEIGERQFLWDTKDISELLEDEDTGTGKKVIGIKLEEILRDEDIEINKSAFQGMKNLQFLLVNSRNVRISEEGLSCLPDKLRLLEWHYYPLTCLPSKFSAKFLAELIMQESKLEKLWDGIKPLQRLKRIVLSRSLYLKEIPDLTNATSLEELDLWGCESLLELTSTIGYATKLKKCILSRCFLLKELPSSMSMLINLEELDLSESTGLKEVSGCSSLEKLSGCSSLKTLNLRETPIWEVPASIRCNWSCLKKLDMSGCRNLKEFPNVPDSIEELVLPNTRIKEIPPWIENLTRLSSLSMYGCEKLKKISPNISKLENLEFLGLRKYEDIDPKVFEAVIEWGDPDSNRSWTLVSDFRVHYILPRCLPAKTRTLYLQCDDITIPNCIRRLSGLIKLDVTGCTMLEALPPLPGSLLYINAEGCSELKRIDSSFQNPNICLNFAYCFSLNQNAKEFIYTSDCKYALLPGKEVPAHFPHQATSGSLTINLTSRPLPSSLRFKACILLSACKDTFKHEDLMMGGVSCHVMGKQNGRNIQYGSKQHHMECRNVKYGDHLFIFEDSFCLKEDCPETAEATLSELVFQFIGDGEIWKVKGWGVRLLFPDSVIDENAADVDGDEDESEDDGDENESKVDDESTLVPGVEVPAHFPYRATSDSLTINQTPQPLPPSLRFKASLLLSRDNIYDADDEEYKNLLVCVSCRFRGKQNGLTVQYGSNKREMPYLYGCDDHMYTFKDSFSLGQDSPEAAEATFSELVFEFKVFYKNWKVKACGVQLLEDKEDSGRDEKEDDEVVVVDGDDDGAEEDIKDDVDKTQEGEESRRDNDGETISKKRWRFSLLRWFT